jgi:hypothetical protein
MKESKLIQLTDFQEKKPDLALAFSSLEISKADQKDFDLMPQFLRT